MSWWRRFVAWLNGREPAPRPVFTAAELALRYLEPWQRSGGPRHRLEVAAAEGAEQDAGDHGERQGDQDGAALDHENDPPLV